jgi:plasmid stabilization system protein ParE
MEVRWSLNAAEDLEHICEWIERDNPEAACRVARTIYDECTRLKDFPNLGRASRAWRDGVNLHSRLSHMSSYIRSH